MTPPLSDQSSALTPALTAYDLKILRAVDGLDVPLFDAKAADFKGIERRNVWQIAQRANELDTLGVLRTLSGLVHLGYAHKTHWDDHKATWIRTGKGDDVVAPPL